MTPQNEIEELAEAETEHDYSAFNERTPQPDIQTLEEWAESGKAETLCGCIVELDGYCEHGQPSWMIKLGYI